MTNYGPQIQACRLYECESKNGNKYFRGRLGSLSIVLLKSREIAPDSGAPIWNLMLGEAPQAQARSAPKDITRENPTRAAQPRIAARDTSDEIIPI